MADRDLIAEYATTLRMTLRWRSDVDDVVCEVVDHLRSATARLEACGADPTSAQRDVLVRFGDATLVAHAFAQTSSGGFTMPTRLTRSAGTFALLAAVAWIAVTPAALIGAGSDDWEAHYATLEIVAFVASACSTIALFGLIRRSGRGAAMSGVALAVAILGTLVLGIVTWAWLVGVVLFTIAAIVVVLSLRAARLGSRLGNAALVLAWPLGIAVAIVLDIMRVGPIDSYGEPFLGQLIGFSVGGLIFAAGMFVSGRWLRRETVAEATDSMAVA